MTAFAQPVTIDPTERQRRKKAIDAARASVHLEGFVLDAEVEGIYAQFIDGQIDMPEVILKVKWHTGLSGRSSKR
ncbi:antitoxin VbhA family protein [Deinococcus marmoris]|uniref:antitoxin VbhA family protein n=1 Tax=Deinococcus marmoris TaxID=249408 RepID=UPI000498624E|nr:antitoxin VbhA family protein [Deinococcus marmoris]